MLMSFLFQMIVMARVEHVIGSLRIMIIYIGSGIIGTLASCVLLPYHVEVSQCLSSKVVIHVIHE
jgi:membrane associated rhomboid family serine protease